MQPVYMGQEFYIVAAHFLVYAALLVFEKDRVAFLLFLLLAAILGQTFTLSIPCTPDSACSSSIIEVNSSLPMMNAALFCWVLAMYVRVPVDFIRSVIYDRPLK